MIYALTCADENFMSSALFQMKTAKEYGKVDKTIIFNLKDMDEDFRTKNRYILQAGGSRRKGCYLWKPYFINKVLEELQIGDYLIYLDAAGMYYRSSVIETIKYMEKKGIEMVCCRKRQFLEKYWTKRDAFVIMGCDTKEYTEQAQCYAGMLVIKKTCRSMGIITEWLKYAQNYNVITNSENVCGLDNYEGFKEHRFDQSILSILLTKYCVKNIEELPIPEFYLYHHTRETSVSAVKKRMRFERHKIYKQYIKNKDIKSVVMMEFFRIINSVWGQRIYKSECLRKSILGRKIAARSVMR